MVKRFTSLFVLAFVASVFAKEPVIVDNTTRTSSTCELHHVQMSRVRVPLHASGIAAPYHDYSRCPHAERPIDTGCINFGDDAYGYIWACPECNKACPR